MKKTNFYTVNFDSDSLSFIDQTKLPNEEVYVTSSSVERMLKRLKNWK